MTNVRILSDALASLGVGSSTLLSSFRAMLAAVPRWTLWRRPFFEILTGALPLAIVAGLAIGAVIWIHTRGVLARTSPDAVGYLPTFLSAAVLLELAPIGAGLILAARTGASLAAELASMKQTEQIDALQLIGVSPLERLVGPRVLASVLASPLLHILIAVLALGSGYVAESLSGSTTWLRYRTAILAELPFVEVILAGCKTLVFGFLVGVTGCAVGIHCEEGSEGVGRAATRSVVRSCLLVLAADIVLVGLIRLIVGP